MELKEMTVIPAVCVGVCLFLCAAVLDAVNETGAEETKLHLASLAPLLCRRWSVRHVVTVAVGGILSYVCTIRMETVLAALTAAAFLAALAAVTLADIETMEIPDRYHVMIALVGVLSVFTQPEIGLLSRVIGVFAVSVPMLLAALAVPDGFGGGDIKLMAACGLVLGWQRVLLAALIGLLLGGAYGGFVLATKRKGAKEHFAFGPFLCVGLALCTLWGETLMGLYWKIFDLSWMFA